MATQEQERRSPLLETARAASDEPQLPGLVPIVAGGSAATKTMATGDIMAGGGDAGKEEQGPERAALDNVRSSSPRVVRSGYSLVLSAHIASPKFQRKPRSHVPARAPPAQWWRFKLPVLPVPPAPAAKKKTRKRRAKKRDMPCLLCKATETPLWRTWPTDRRVPLCNACGIKVRTPGLLLPELMYLSPPATAMATVLDSAELEHPVARPPQEIQPSQLYVNLPPPPVPEVAVLPSQLHVNLPRPASATTTVVSASELEHPPPQQEIQDSDSSPPDSPTLDSTLDLDVYLLRRTSPRRREKSPSPPPPPPPPPTAAEFAPAAADPAPGNENDEPERSCLHCGATSTRQWRMGPMGVRTLCNPCGVRYRQNRLVPEYRPKASPSFNQEVHSNLHREVVQIRRKQNHPAPPAKYKPIRTRKRRRNKGKGPAQVPKKRKGNQEEVLLVRKKGNTQRLPPEPALLKLRKERNGEEHRRRSPQPAQAQPRAGDGMVQHEPPPPPPLALLPHTGNDDIVQDLPPPPPPAQPHAGDDMMQDLNLPPALPHAGGELMMDDPIPPPDAFLFDGPAAPMIIDDDPVIVIVIDDD